MAQNDNPFSAMLDISKPQTSPSPAAASQDEQVVKSFTNALNSRNDPSTLMEFFAEDIDYVDTSYYNPIVGKEALSKHFYLHAGSSVLSTFGEDYLEVIVIDNIVATGGEDIGAKVSVIYHLTTAGGEDVPDTTAISFYNLQQGKIAQVFDVTEPASPKPGDGGLKLLKTVSNLIGDESIVVKSDGVADNTIYVVEKYSDAWNRR